MGADSEFRATQGTIDVATYVVNLARRPDRRRRMAAVLPSSINAEFTTPWEGPFDGRTLDLEDLTGVRLFPWQIESDNIWWSRPLKKGEIACSLAHLACWRRGWASGAERVLIFEDDVAFEESFDVEVKAGLASLDAHSPEWDLVYLGRVPMEPGTPAFGHLVVPGYSHCTYAYMLARRAIPKLLEARLEWAVIPIDEFLPAMYDDHPRPDVRRRFPKTLSAFAFEPPVVTQLPKAVAGSDSEDSEFVDEAWIETIGSEVPAGAG